MSLLSDRDIAREFEKQNIEISTPDVAGNESWRLQPASLELTLNGADEALLGYAQHEFWETPQSMIAKRAIIDPENPPPLVRKSWQEGTDGRAEYLLQPGEFLLGSTAERIRLAASLYGSVEGKSSLGRMGLMIHITAGHIDPGWDGVITLEFFNAAPRPIRLRAGMRVAQLLVGRMSSPSERPYGHEALGSHYQGSLGTVQALSVTLNGARSGC